MRSCRKCAQFYRWIHKCCLSPLPAKYKVEVSSALPTAKLDRWSRRLGHHQICLSDSPQSSHIENYRSRSNKSSTPTGRRSSYKHFVPARINAGTILVLHLSDCRYLRWQQSSWRSEGIAMINSLTPF
jgi:hypothetical protein